MTTSSMVLVLALSGALFAVLVWGFRRAGDGPRPPKAGRGHESDNR
jgi:hypothetical protein